MNKISFFRVFWARVGVLFSMKTKKTTTAGIRNPEAQHQLNEGYLRLLSAILEIPIGKLRRALRSNRKENLPSITSIAEVAKA